MGKPELRVVRPFMPELPGEDWAHRYDYGDKVYAEAKAENARKVLARESNLLPDSRKYRLCDCGRPGCGLILLWSNGGYHPVPPEDAVEETPIEAAPEPQRESKPKPVTWPKAVSRLQIEWAKRQLDILNAGGKTDVPREALEALASTSPEGLPYRAADRYKPTKPVAKSGKTRKTVNKS